MRTNKISRSPFMDIFSPEFMNRFMGEFTPSDEVSSAPVAFRPAAEIVKKDDSFQLSLSLPGVKKEDVKIELENNRLVISGERKSEHSESENGLVRSEITYGRFSRSFTLSQEIEKDGIEATFTDGMLSIKLPVSEKVLPKAVEIK